MRTNFYANENLRRIYKERVGDSMTQAKFAKLHKIGGQSMLAQIMSGAKPLPIETASKLARALHCNIHDFCPEMAIFIRDELLPSMGKGWRRAAALLLCTFIPSLVPPDANAFNKKIIVVHTRQVADLNTHCSRIGRRIYKRLLSIACKWQAMKAPTNVRLAIAS